MKAALEEFRAMFPGIEPDAGTAAQWLRLMRLAFTTQNDLVDFHKRHTTRSRWWSEIGKYAKARSELVP
jgi:hypothetical protein